MRQSYEIRVAPDYSLLDVCNGGFCHARAGRNPLERGPIVAHDDVAKGRGDLPECLPAGRPEGAGALWCRELMGRHDTADLALRREEGNESLDVPLPLTCAQRLDERVCRPVLGHAP